jgi:uncharacterized membrane protein
MRTRTLLMPSGRVRLGLHEGGAPMEPYDLVKYVHVLSAITAVGLNLSYGVWLARTGAAPEHRPYVLRGIKLLDDRMANPAYVLLLLTGFAMVGIGSLSLTTTWIAVSLALYVVLVVLGLGVFSRSLGRQIELAESAQGESAAYAETARRTTWSGALLVLIAVVIVFLMVTKPTL